MTAVASAVGRLILLIAVCCATVISFDAARAQPESPLLAERVKVGCAAGDAVAAAEGPACDAS